MSYEGFRVVEGKLQRLGKKYSGFEGEWREVESVANCHGYCHVKVNGKPERYHRILWVLINGPIPAGLVIDHLDGDKLNNNIDNLRLVSQRENLQNLAIHRDGRLVGACFHKQHNKWIAQIKINKKLIHLGYYDTEQEAHEAYTKALAAAGGTIR